MTFNWLTSNYYGEMDYKNKSMLKLHVSHTKSSLNICIQKNGPTFISRCHTNGKPIHFGIDLNGFRKEGLRGADTNDFQGQVVTVNCY